jgi:hypothetical protein
MGWLGYRRQRRAAVKAAKAAQGATMTGTEPWLAHGLHDGDSAECASCGRTQRVKLLARARVIVTSEGVLDGVIRICAGCGRLLCADCTVGRNPSLRECDTCGAPVVVPMA